MKSSYVTLGDHGAEVATATWGEGPPGIVLLHDGLGSVSQWRTIPARLSELTALTVMAYDRPGHGRSTPTPSGPWPSDWLHDQAELLDALLDAVGAESPVLVGHSDGGSIALIHAATTGRPSRTVALAAHSWVEPAAADRIASMRTDPAAIVAGLTRHHAQPHALFDAWSGVWTSEEFSRWDIRPMLSSIASPTLLVQGDADEYATVAQLTETAAAIGQEATYDLVPDAGHLLHHHDPEGLTRRIARFVLDVEPSVHTTSA